MAISRFSTSRVGAGLPKYQKFWDGSTVYRPPAFHSIATQNVTTTGVTNVEFTSIPDTYKHLQVRFLTGNTGSQVYIRLQFNSDTGSNYAWHEFYGDGNSVTKTYGSTDTQLMLGRNNTGTYLRAAGVVDILDYTNTNKYKVTRSLSGFNSNSSDNGTHKIELVSGLWQNTNAITSLKIYASGDNITQNSYFALYGIKG